MKKLIRSGASGAFLVTCMFVPQFAWGHGVELFAAVEGNEIRGTLAYHDGPPIADAPVRAYAPDGELIVETTTSEDGKFTLPVSRHCDYRIVGDAGAGHLGSHTVKESELPPSVAAESGHHHHEDLSVGAGDLESRIQAAVSRELAPLREQLYQHDQSIRLRDLLGGIGYLFGLAGLVALLKNRKSAAE